MEDREEVPGDLKYPWPTRARKKTECPLPSTPENHEEKAATKLSPKLYQQIHHAPGRSGGEALQDSASPRAYGQSCGHEGPKMQGNPPEVGRRHAADPRVYGREEILHLAGGKPAKWPSLDFLIIHRGKDSQQTPKTAVCHGLGGRHRDREVPFLSVPSAVKLNFQRYITKILEDFLAVLKPHGHLLGRNLLVMQHLEGLHPHIGLQHPMHGRFAQHWLRWSKFCSFSEVFVAAFSSWFSGVDGSGHSVFFRALVGQGCFRVPGTTSRSSTLMNGSYPAVLLFQHHFFEFCEA